MSQIISKENSCFQKKRGREKMNKSTEESLISCNRCEEKLRRKLMKQCAKCNNYLCSSCQIHQPTAHHNSISCSLCNNNNWDNPKIQANKLSNNENNGSKVGCEICAQYNISLIKFKTVNEVFDYLKSKNLFRKEFNPLSIKHKLSMYKQPRIFCENCFSQLFFSRTNNFELFFSVLGIESNKTINNESQTSNNENYDMMSIKNIFSVEKTKKKKRKRRGDNQLKTNNSNHINIANTGNQLIDLQPHQNKEEECEAETNNSSNPNSTFLINPNSTFIISPNSDNINANDNSNLNSNNNNIIVSNAPMITQTNDNTMIQLNNKHKTAAKKKQKTKQKTKLHSKNKTDENSIKQHAMQQYQTLMEIQNSHILPYQLLIKNYVSFVDSLKKISEQLKIIQNNSDDSCLSQFNNSDQKENEILNVASSSFSPSGIQNQKTENNEIEPMSSLKLETNVVIANNINLNNKINQLHLFKINK